MKLKNLTRKIMAILFIVLMMINSSMLTVISTAIDEVVKIIDKTKVQALVELGVEKYVNYQLDEQTKGVVLQTNIKTGIEYQEGQEYSAIKSAGILLNMPKINEEYPEKVEVIGISTKATNGGEKAKDYEQLYEKETGELKIVALNKEDENGNIYKANIENARDEYTVIAYYGANCYTGTNEERVLDISGKVKLIVADDENSDIEKEINENYKVKENISGLISTKVETSDIYNGYIESNINNNTTYKTEYTEKLGIDISYKEISDEMVINTKDNFVKNGEKQETEEIIYKNSKINKQEVLDKLGEEGNLKILNANGELLAEINKDTETKENGTIEIEYNNETRNIIISTSKPINVGTITIESTKQIKESMKDLANTKISTDYKVEAINNIEIKDEETNEVREIQKNKIYEYTSDKEIEIKSAETRIDTTIDKTEWTNNVQNEVNLTVKLGANREDRSLLKNTSIKIDFPNEVEKVIIKNSQLRYGNGINLQEPYVEENNNGKLSIICNLIGEQNSYLSNDLDLETKLDISLNVILKKDIESKKENIIVECINENIISNQKEMVNKNIEIGIIHYEEVNEADQYGIQTNSGEASVVNSEDIIANDGLELNVDAIRGEDILKNNDTVYEGEYIKYNIKVKNNTNNELTNIKVKAIIPDGTKYGELKTDFERISGIYEYEFDETLQEKEFTIENLKAGEEYSTYYEVQVKDLEDNENTKSILTNIKTYVGTQEIQNYEMSNIVKRAKAKVFLKASLDDGPGLWNYVAVVETDKEVELKIVLPKEYEFMRAWNPEISYAYDNGEVTVSEDNVISIKVSNGTYYFGGNITNDRIKNENKNNIVELKATASVELDGIKYQSNENRIQYKYAGIYVKMTSDNEGEEVKYKDEINYQITVECLGGTNLATNLYSSVSVNLVDYLPENVDPVSMTYNYFEEITEVFDEIELNSGATIPGSRVPTGEFKETTITKDISGISKDENGNRLPDLNLNLTIPFGKKVTIDVKTTAGFVYKKTTIENRVEVTGSTINTKESNIIKHTILPYDYEVENPDNPESPDNPNNPDNPESPDNPNNPDNPDNPDNPNQNKCNISGIVWIDENEDSQRQDEETKASNVVVMLVNMKDTKNVMAKTQTAKNGYYSFSDLDMGEYIVLFKYNTEEFQITEYKKSGVSNSHNSDAFNQEITLNGEKVLVASTDILTINSDTANIDLGLVKNKVFDLKLDKTISKVTVNAGGKTKIYDYNNKKLAKVEINRKKIDGAIVTIEYNITVTNEGELTGVVDKIIDYIPEGFDIEEDSITSWSKQNDGTLVTKGLLNKTIDAGDSENIKLVVTKKLSSTEIGTIKNNVEIAEAHNNKKIKDIDSIYGNKSETEDDYSSAELIVSISTGRTIICTVAIVIGLIAILCFMVLVSKRKWNKRLMITLIIGIIGLSMILVDNNKVFAREPDWYISNFCPAETYYKWCVDSSRHWCPHGNSSHNDKYNNSEGSKHFLGGVNNAGGFCCDDGLEPKNGTYKFVGTFLDTPKTNDISSDKDFSIQKGSTSPELKLSGDNYILGPFKIETTNYSGGYLTAVYDKDGNAINDVSYCDSRGNAKNEVSGETTFYLKFPQANLTSKISKVVSLGAITVEDWHWEYNDTLLIYKYDNTHQRVLADLIWTYNCRGYKNERTIMHTLTWDNISSTGNIKITKKDADNGSSLSGAKFRVTGPNYDKTITVNGESTLSNLLIGGYTIKETSAPDGYNLSLQGNVTKTATVTAGGTATVNYTNTQFGNLVIKKVDANTGNALPGVKFKIWKNGYITEQTTDSSGIIRLNNLRMGTYYIQEIAISNDMVGYYELDSTVHNVKLKNNYTEGDTNITINNQQAYTDISGLAFEDVAYSNGKETLNNYLYNNTVKDINDKFDKTISGITVRLKDANNNQVLQTVTTGNDGKYKFTKVKITELGHYYIEFEYNGLKYESIPVKADNNGSKAIEKTADRTVFNNSYSNITGGNVKGTNTTGNSKNESGTITNNLTYKNGNYSSSLVQNTGYTVGSANGIVTAQNGSSGVSIKADTNTAGNIITWSEGTKNIQNINMGVKVRAQTDLAIATDIDTVDLKINGYTHTYTYNKRTGLKDSNGNSVDIFSVATKYNNNVNDYPTTYTRSIYKNYAYASGITGKGAISDKLEFYTTYKIIIKNEGSQIVSANEVANYCDKNFDMNKISSWYIDSSGNKVDINWTNKGEKNGYYEIRTTSLKDVKINSGESITVYLKLSKKAEQVLSWAKIQETSKLQETSRNITEITSYSTYTSDGKGGYLHYAAIDTDSAPDNVKPGDVSTYEDDTDSAPALTITFDELRTISGYVYEDETSRDLLTGQARKGDGKYNSSKDGFVSGVTVELIKKENGKDSLAYIYPQAVTEANFNAKEAKYITTAEGKGYYEFTGVIPGEYYLKFTYGDGSVIYKNSKTTQVDVQNYKSTIITNEAIKAGIGNNVTYDGNTRWYQTVNGQNYSAAVDDWQIREGIDSSLSTITNKAKISYEGIEGRIMTARTPNMSIAIENTNGENTNENEKRVRVFKTINFGIVERPRQSLDINKEISNIKLILSNGQEICSGDPRTDNLPYVTYPQNGILKIEIDSEILEGATLNLQYVITVTNNSELDYHTRDYYYYGKASNNNIVKTKINSIIDHMDENLTTTYTYDKVKGNWYVVNPQELKNNGLISQEVYNSISDNHNVLVNECNKELAPKESFTINVEAGKLLSTSEDTTYKNYVELLQVTNLSGRFYNSELIETNGTNKWRLDTPGNYVIDDKNTHEGDDNGGNKQYRAQIAIIPPTGDIKYYYYAIGITALVIIVGGIVFIKKKVL